MLKLGIDIGSKTIKLVVLDDEGQLLYSSYQRHLSNVKDTLSYSLRNAIPYFSDEPMAVGVTGSAGMTLSAQAGLPFIQEVVAARAAIRTYAPETDVAIEIGGEDSKVLFLTGGEELRMNSTCAGGTGGFIDTIAGMLDANAEKLNFYAHGCKTYHPIASRCAVFAQMDVRPLLNQGVSKEDIAGSALDAVAVQCISGLACGRTISGNVMFIGGPLHFLAALRDRFMVRLNLDKDQVIVPPEGHLFVAMGAALAAGEQPIELSEEKGAIATISQLKDRLDGLSWNLGATLNRLEPLFRSKEEYDEFRERHGGLEPERADFASYEGTAYLGIDSGSEAIKYVLIDEEGRILRTYYERSAGNVIDAAHDMLLSLLKQIPRLHDKTPAIKIGHVTVTGYGEGFLKAAYKLDSGEVETVCHLEAAKALVPDVDFVLDIGGQDIKCLQVRNGLLDNVVLNEACSSGCGALLSGMAWSMNVRFDRFLKYGLLAQEPVDLGTRCTVFMTSRVRHAQKEGATTGDISAGLAYSVVKNAIYKVIRAKSVESLGKRIVVQGGTFMNDGVLRAFERTVGREVYRPEIAAYMGAYGAALLARRRARKGEVSTMLDRQRVEKLRVRQDSRACTLCANHCMLTETYFSDKGEMRTFIVGNRCQRPLGGQQEENLLPDLFEVRNRKLFKRAVLGSDEAPRGSIGILRALDMYDLYPFWHAFFTQLGFRVELSRLPGNKLQGGALETIPSESVCYPAKLMHGHCCNLAEREVPYIFAPYVNGTDSPWDACPVAAGYPLVLDANGARGQSSLISPEIPVLFSDGEVTAAAKESVLEALKQVDAGITMGEVTAAAEAGIRAQRAFRDEMLEAGREALAQVEAEGGRAVVLAGRPYHGDPAVHHGIAALLQANGYAVLSLDSVPDDADSDIEVSWNYADQVLRAAAYAAQQASVDFVELYSFGCGLDAVTTDKARSILEGAGKIFTALKIDEMTDLAAVKIRIRSMMAASGGELQ